MKLNQEQKRAVEHKSGPLLVIAGAGTGKTTVITERVKWLITKKGLSPSQILALTFTEKAATEMEERVDQALPLGYSQLWISTFHSFCDHLLQNEAVHLGLNSNYRILSSAESILFLKKHLFDLKLDYFRPATDPTKFLGDILSHFSRLQDEDILANQYLRFAQKVKKGAESDGEKMEAKKVLELAHVFKKYQELKEKEGLMDFADLIGYSLKLFRERPNVLKKYQERFRFILVDEFQDTNIAQYELIKLLAPPEETPNLMVTGDDSQSIYKFRGAAVSNILSFQEDYHESETVTLSKNYRSTQKILDASYQLIQQNNPDTLESKLGISKNLKSTKKNSGESIGLVYGQTVEDEAEQVAKKIQQLVQKGYQYQDMAILVRANNHAEPFIRALSRQQIPSQFLGPEKLFRQGEIKELIAYLQLLADLGDDIAFFKIASIKELGIKARQLAELRSLAKRENLSLFKAAEIKIKKSKQKTHLSKLIKITREQLKNIHQETGGQILYNFLEKTGLLKKIINPQSASEQQKSLNISRFFEKVKAFENSNSDSLVFDLLNWIDLRMELGESPSASQMDWLENNAVNVLTVHSAKGLEFSVVFLVNLVNRRFPTTRRSERIPLPQPLIKEILPEGDPHEQEERRLFYVAMTRAKDLLYFTAAKFYGEGRREKKISPFVTEAIGEKRIKSLIKDNHPDTKQLSLESWNKKDQEEKTIRFSKPIHYLSYSRLNSFEICPLQYKYKYLLQLPTFPSVGQTFGTIIHRTLKEFYQQQMIADKKLPIKKLLETLKENWRSSGFSSRDQEKELYKQAQEIFKNYFQRELQNKPFPKVAGLEQPFSLRLTPELKIGGVIDRIDLLKNNQVEIIDYKTSSHIPNQRQVDNDQQLTIYALATTSISEFDFSRPIDQIILSLYFLEKGIKISTRRNEKQIIKFKEKVLQAAQEIEKSNFLPKPGSPFPCNWCEYKLLCDAWH